MEKNFEPIIHTISNVQIGNVSTLGVGDKQPSIVKEDNQVAKCDSGVIKPFVPSDEKTVPNVVFSYQQSTDCNEVELPETNETYNDIKISRNK